MKRKRNEKEIKNKYDNIDESLKKMDRKIKDGRIMKVGKSGSKKV
jgi:urease alpha subunit